ncbi:MAG: cupin domain-containing protein [Pseudomonadales bacterium]|nr:cupin domain-containing protein [Pseudomonadales bacterium]
MKKLLMVTSCAVMLWCGFAAAETVTKESSAKSGKVKVENMMSAVLEGVPGTEVIVSRVHIPPHSTLPKHWHPGEEFAYILQGKAILVQEGKEDVVTKAGEAIKIPLKQIHSARTESEGAVIVVFRVHSQGEPERVLVP